MRDKNKTKEEKKIYLILDNIRSNFNVGSLFRIADCAGISKIYLCGTTPAPVDRFGRDNREVKKVALGADQNISWKKVSSAVTLIGKLKKDKFQIVSLEQSRDSVDYKKLRARERMAFVVGNEVDGVSKKILKISDKIIEIPMKGKKESLNVAVATAVALFRVLEI